MKLKIKTLILILLASLFTSCSFLRQQYYGELSYDEIEEIDKFVKHCIDNIDKIKNPYEEGNYKLWVTSKEIIKKHFTGKKYNLCMHRIGKRSKNKNEIHGNLIYSTQDSDWKLNVGVYETKTYGISLTVHINFQKNCKFWKWENEGQPLTGDAE